MQDGADDGLWLDRHHLERPVEHGVCMGDTAVRVLRERKVADREDQEVRMRIRDQATALRSVVSCLGGFAP